MNHFTIRDVEYLSGIKAHTWRIWEQRYGLCLPQRKASMHRYYDAGNLKQILRIAYLYHGGIKISKIAKLNDEEVNALATQLHDDKPLKDFYIKEMLEANFDSNAAKFDDVCTNAFKKMGAENAVLQVIYPFLEKIGLLWLTDNVVPAQEHFTSNIIRNKLIVAIDNLPQVLNAKEGATLLFTPEKEHHELPLLFIYYLLKKRKKPVRYFGTNISLPDLKSYLGEAKAETIHFHLITNLTGKTAQHYIEELSVAFPTKSIVMSGTQVAQITSAPPNVRLLGSMAEILNYTD